jgi:hypothetical protein
LTQTLNNGKWMDGLLQLQSRQNEPNCLREQFKKVGQMDEEENA